MKTDQEIAVRLASLIKDAKTIKEASYVRTASQGGLELGWYTKSHETAAREAGAAEDLHEFVVYVLDAGDPAIDWWTARVLGG
jgi:hypothetical protein